MAELLRGITILPGFTPVTDKEQLLTATELYYELGYFRTVEDMYAHENWQRLNRFTRVEDIRGLYETDERLGDPEYLAHHNFMYR